MRNNKELDEQAARAILRSAQSRAEQINQASRSSVQAFALRPETFIAVLRAQPGLLRWDQLKGSLQYHPFFNVDGADWRIVITDEAMGSQAFRAKVTGFMGSYLEAPRAAGA
jgi:hypothetical protein